MSINENIHEMNVEIIIANIGIKVNGIKECSTKKTGSKESK